MRPALASGSSVETPTPGRAALRRLAASWPNYQDVTTGPWHASILRTVRSAFPDLVGGIDVIAISSSQKRWDVLELSDNDRLIVVDTAYSTMLERIQTAMLAPECPPAARYSLAHAVFGWALFAAGDYARACAVCANAFQPQGIDWLMELKPVWKDRAANAWTFALLHEAAHAIVDWPSEAAANAWEYAEESAKKIERYYSQLINVIDTSGGFSRYTSSTGFDFSDRTQWPNMRGQMIAQRARVTGNKQLQREMACDLLALKGALTLRLGTDPLGDQPRTLTLEELQICHGILVLAAQAFEMMLTIANLRSMAAGVRDRDVSATHDVAVELLARQNTLNHVCLTLLENVPLAQEAEAARGRAADGFTAGRRRFESRLIARLVDPVSAINTRLHDDTLDRAMRDEAAPFLREMATDIGIEAGDQAGLAAALLGDLPL